MPNIDEERIVLTPTAPMTTIQYSNAGWNDELDRCVVTPNPPPATRLPVTVPMPANYTVPAFPQKNSGAAFLMPDRRTLIQTQPLARCVAGGAATSVARLTDNGVDADIFGNGRVGAHGGSRLSTLGGTIRRGEMRPGSRGPRHALKFVIWEKMEFHNCDGTAQNPCFRWPAFVADNGAATNYGSIQSNVPEMRMGALLAIPASVNLDTIGLESEPGRQIAWTLQNYGAYVVDSAGGAGFTIAAEDGAHGTKADEFAADYPPLNLKARVRDNTAWTRDLQRIRPLLHVVDNNSPTSIGGGGTPRQILAPPFQ